MTTDTAIALGSLGVTVAGWLISFGKARQQLNGFGGRQKRFEEMLSAETAERKNDVRHIEDDVKEIRQEKHGTDLQVEHRITLLEARKPNAGE